jgi:hypothetical protein
MVMMPINVTIELHPLIVKTPPLIFLGASDSTVPDYHKLTGPMTIEKSFEFKKSGPHTIILGFTNKNYSECSVDGDMAVIIDSIKFQNFNHDFKIFSQYFPDYPSDWRADGHDCPKAIHSNYLGWNGIWVLDFETPIYRWIHQRLDLGWLI